MRKQSQGQEPEPRGFVRLQRFEQLRRLKRKEPEAYMSMSVSIKLQLELYLTMRRAQDAREKLERRRQKIMSRGAFCQCCGENLYEALTLDHVIPRARGGTGDPVNIQVLCLLCNSMKGDGEECPHMAEVRRLMFEPSRFWSNRGFEKQLIIQMPPPQLRLVPMPLAPA